VRKLNVICGLLLCCTPAWSQNLSTATQKSADNTIDKRADKIEPQKVTINAAQTDIAASRDFAAGKLIIGRQRIADSGLQNAAEMLKREPAVTVGKDGQIGLLGLPGYTQILLNGQNPVGRNPLDMDLSEIERIEIIKSATAQTGPFGIAGSINIITRKIARTKSQQVSAGVKDAAGAYGVNGAWSINEASLDSPWQSRLSVSVDRRHDKNPFVFVQNEGDSEQKAPAQFQGQGRTENILEGLSIESNFAYRFNTENTLSFNPSANYLKLDTQNEEDRYYANGTLWQILGNSNTKLLMLSAPLSWSRQVGEDGQLKVDVSASRNQVLTSSDSRNRLNAPSPMTSHSLSEDNTDTNTYRLNVNYVQSMEGGHELTTGLNWTKKVQNSTNHYWLNGRPDVSLAQFGAANRLDNAALRLFIQDEWRMNKTTAFNAGMSGEDSASDIREGPLVSRAHYRVWSPTFHFSKKVPGDIKRQFRLSLAKSFKAPYASSLMLRPNVNVLAPCSSYLVCPQNSLDTTDSAGNPGLQAERALALNLSYEHGLSDDSQIGFEVYARQIEQQFGRAISLETVAWSTLPRYVSRPVNIGDAQIVGASVDWTLALRDAWQTAPKIEVRGSVGRAHSVVSNLPAPYNHLEGQTPWRAKLGMTYDVTGVPLKINVDANWLPGDWIRNNLVQKTYESRHASYSANATWTASKTMKWIMSLNNLFAPTKYGIKEYIFEGNSGQKFIQRQSEKTSYTQLSVRVEIKL
jgi:hypothetical protein